MDNRQIKDGLGNIFTIRMRDLSSGQDGSYQRPIQYMTQYPLDYGGGGHYQYCIKSNIVLAAQPANSPIVSFTWLSAVSLAALFRVRLVAWSNTMFNNGVGTFDIYAARNFSSGDTGGVSATFTGETNQLRTSMGSSGAYIAHAATAALTPGVRTLDPYPLDSRSCNVGNTANTLFSNMPMTLFEKTQSEHPLILVMNEGFVIQATLPPDGAWLYTCTLDWAEIPTTY
jgi:hypothetical protein